MNKKLLAVAVAGALVAPAAMAEVEVYGKAHVSVGQLDNDSPDGSSMVMQSNNSNIGFRGGEDLGGGLKAEFQAEVAMNWDGGTGPLAAAGSGWGSGRDTWVGLAGDWGKFRMGRANTPYKVATNNMDPFGDTFADYNAIMGISPEGNKHDDRASNALIYMTNDINGFMFAGAYAVNDGIDANTKADRSALSLAAMYHTGPFTVAAAYQSAIEYGATPTGATTADDDVAMKIGGTWMFNNDMTGISAIWENIDGGGNNNDRDSYYFSATHMVGQTKLAIGYGAADDVGDIKDSGAQLMQLGAFHNLSKATQVYAIYGSVGWDKSTSSIFTPAGSTSPVNTSTGYGLNTGSVKPFDDDKSATGIMLGVVHSFSSK